MPVSVKPMQVPDPSTWCRALRRYDRDPRLPMMYASYSVTIRAKPVEIDGRVALTLFFPNGRESAADRALKLGWIDEEGYQGGVPLLLSRLHQRKVPFMKCPHGGDQADRSARLLDLSKPASSNFWISKDLHP